ncbi:MAG: hypothetical protein AAF998_18000 [Bacteroidota bacterium]
MSTLQKTLDQAHKRFLSEKTKKRGEIVIIYAAIVAFVLHLLVIFLVDTGIIQFATESKLLTNPIAAIYTPFSFILIYEIYLLVYYLPKSITVYIGKQYEVITLILIRRLFKDLANLQITSDWFQQPEDLQFTVDLLGTIALFVLIYLFNRLNPKKVKPKGKTSTKSETLVRFIRQKRDIATLLVPTILILAVVRLGQWVYEHWLSFGEFVYLVKDVNQVFFDEFFTLLILVDVLLLLLSFLHTHQFAVIIRNSGFIISTIMIRMSFGVEGWLNTILVVSAVMFGVIMLWVYTRYSNANLHRDTSESPSAKARPKPPVGQGAAVSASGVYTPAEPVEVKKA